MKIHPVHIVGGGPGDPELLTLKAHRVLSEQTEVLVYDRLISKEILALVPASAERVYAGKSAGFHEMSQDEINANLLKYAKAGKKVTRLKGGDPFIFGRGGEEIEFLHDHGIPFHVIPGINAAGGVAAVLGIPLTHRDLATGVRFISGHKKKDQKLELPWKELADPATTLVVYMGLTSMPEVTKELIAAGLPEHTLAAAVQNATTDKQRHCFAPVGEIAARVKEQGLEPPVLLIIGDVVKVAAKLSI